jgi:hypothetical protein
MKFGYFIYCDNIVIVVNDYEVPFILPIREDVSKYEEVRMRSPYVCLIKIDLIQQIYGKNLKRHLKKKVMNKVLLIPEVKCILRNEKLKRILNE